MESDFEKGKALIIEGVEGLVKTYEPALNLLRGMKKLGITTEFGDIIKVEGGIEPWEHLVMVINTWLADFRKAKNMEEVEETLENAKGLFKRLF